MPEHGDTALLVMDVQEDIVSRFADATMLEPLQRALAVARAHGVTVIFVKVGFRPSYPEVSPDNRSFSRLVESGGMIADEQRIHPAVAPAPGEIEVVKKRVSAFAGSDLELVLRAQGIRTLVLTGIATSGVVLSTVRAAADLDFRLTVLSDCCIDADDEVHRVLLEKVFPRQAEVCDVERWEQHLNL